MENIKREEDFSEDHRTLAKNTIYSIFNNYGTFIFQIIISILLARLLSQNIWGYLILATSIIYICSIILSFFPPALNYSLNFYIPRYIALNESSKLKSLIKNSILLKLLFATIILLLSIFVFYFFSSFFSYNLSIYTHLLFILAPLIFIEDVHNILLSIYQGFLKFKPALFLTIMRYLINTIGVFLCFFINNLRVEFIAFVNLFSALIPFLINCGYFLKLFRKLQAQESESSSIKEDLSKVTKYGKPLSISVLLNEIWKKIRVLLVGSLGNPSLVTGYNVSVNYSAITLNATTSFSSPLIPSLSSLDAKEKDEQVNIIFNSSFKFSSFLLLLLTGIIIFLADFFLFILGVDYLTYSYMVKIYSLSVIFTVLINILIPLLNATNKSKYLPLITIVNLVVIIPFFTIGLIYYEVIGSIYGLIIANFLLFLFQIIISFRVGKVKLQLSKILYLYVIFFVSLGSALILEIFLYKSIRITILESLNLELFKDLQILAFLTFIGIYFLLSILLKIFSYAEIEFLENLFTSNRKLLKIIKKVLSLFRKITYRNQIQGSD